MLSSKQRHKKARREAKKAQKSRDLLREQSVIESPKTGSKTSVPHVPLSTERKQQPVPDMAQHRWPVVGAPENVVATYHRFEAAESEAIEKQTSEVPRSKPYREGKLEAKEARTLQQQQSAAYVVTKEEARKMMAKWLKGGSVGSYDEVREQEKQQREAKAKRQTRSAQQTRSTRQLEHPYDEHDDLESLDPYADDVWEFDDSSRCHCGIVCHCTSGKRMIRYTEDKRKVFTALINKSLTADQLKQKQDAERSVSLPKQAATAYSTRRQFNYNTLKYDDVPLVDPMTVHLSSPIAALVASYMPDDFTTRFNMWQAGVTSVSQHFRKVDRADLHARLKARGIEDPQMLMIVLVRCGGCISGSFVLQMLYQVPIVNEDGLPTHLDPNSIWYGSDLDIYIPSTVAAKSEEDIEDEQYINQALKREAPRSKPYHEGEKHDGHEGRKGKGKGKDKNAKKPKIYKRQDLKDIAKQIYMCMDTVDRVDWNDIVTTYTQKHSWTRNETSYEWSDYWSSRKEHKVERHTFEVIEMLNLFGKVQIVYAKHMATEYERIHGTFVKPADEDAKHTADVRSIYAEAHAKFTQHSTDFDSDVEFVGSFGGRMPELDGESPKIGPSSKAHNSEAGPASRDECRAKSHAVVDFVLNTSDVDFGQIALTGGIIYMHHPRAVYNKSTTSRFGIPLKAMLRQFLYLSSTIASAIDPAADDVYAEVYFGARHTADAARVRVHPPTRRVAPGIADAVAVLNATVRDGAGDIRRPARAALLGTTMISNAMISNAMISNAMISAARISASEPDPIGIHILDAPLALARARADTGDRFLKLRSVSDSLTMAFNLRSDRLRKYTKRGFQIYYPSADCMRTLTRVAESSSHVAHHGDLMEAITSYLSLLVRSS